MSVTILQGDVTKQTATLPDESVNCVVTSPPYWGLRDYGVPGQLGLEPTLDEYVERMVEVFRGVWRALRDDGTLWLNMGDSYATGTNAKRNPGNGDCASRTSRNSSVRRHPDGLKAKDLIGQPWRLAFALQADGWYLRSDIIWHKPNPMPESCRDRPTKSHEYVFLLTKKPRYYYDHEAVKEPQSAVSIARRKRARRTPYAAPGQTTHTGLGRPVPENATRNRRDVWTIPTQAFRGAHFATFPEKLVEPCIKAGCPKGGMVLDPFAGSGTVGVVAERLGRHSVLVELNPEYVDLIKKRVGGL